jgi:hypothetical protein
MTVLAFCWMLLQSVLPTVGDTIWVSRTIAVRTGYVVRAAEWEPSDPVELLGRARVVVTGDSAEVSYPIVIWRPGRHLIEVPGPLLLGAGGIVDSLEGQRAQLLVQSILPAGSAESLPPPQPRAGLVPRQELSILPLVLLWTAGLVGLVPLHLWWRRRGKPMPPLAPIRDLPEPPLTRWADDGEYRAVANVAAARLRSTIAQRVAAAHPGLDTERLLAELAAVRPQWPLEELGELLRALDDARFGNSGSSRTLELSQSSLTLSDRLREAA